jgi:hypothetical protein
MKKLISLHQYIEFKGVTQQQAADEIGISRPYLNMILAGRRPVGRQAWLKLIKWGGGKIDLEPLMLAGLENQIKDDFDSSLSRKIDNTVISMEG